MSENQEETRKILPMIIHASAGNVGLRIDLYRTTRYINNRPRNHAFTTAFHGIMYEDNTLKNAKRMLKREAQRKILEVKRNQKLVEYQLQCKKHQLQVEAKRKKREIQRNKKMWDHYQSMKSAMQQQLETRSAITIQALHRGHCVRKQVMAEREAATRIQLHLRRLSARKIYDAVRKNHEKLRQESAAKIQVHVRRAQSMKRLKRLKNIEQCESFDLTESVKDGIACANSDLILPSGSTREPDVATVDTISGDRRSIEMQLPGLDTALTTPVQVQNAETLLESAKKPVPPQPKQQPNAQPKTMTMKRVGGGFTQIVKNHGNKKPHTPDTSLLPSSASKPEPVPSPSQGRQRRRRWLKTPSQTGGKNPSIREYSGSASSECDYARMK